MNTAKTTIPDAEDGERKHSAWKSSGDGRWRNVMRMHRTVLERWLVVEASGSKRKLLQRRTNSSELGRRRTKATMLQW
jgi:hypothetical protein